MLMGFAFGATAISLSRIRRVYFCLEDKKSGGFINGRTRGSVAWGLFYAVFVAAVAVHAPIGVRNIFAEFGWRGRGVDVLMLVLALTLVMWGLRAVWAVVS